MSGLAAATLRRCTRLHARTDGDRAVGFCACRETPVSDRGTLDDDSWTRVDRRRTLCLDARIRHRDIGDVGGSVAAKCRPGAQPPAPPAQNATDDDYGYAKGYLTDAQREGRDTWYFWTGGNEKFWIKMAELTEGNVNLLAYVDSRLHGRRFATLGAITQPGCRAATAPDQYGLWMDRCDQPAVPGVPGEPERRRRSAPVPQPEASIPRTGTPRSTSSIRARCSRRTSSAWRAGSATSASTRSTRRRIPKRRAGRTSPARSATSTWEEGRLFNLRMPPTDFRWHVGNRQPPGTSDTSRFATDHINNPNAINSVFNLAYRPTEPEKMADGSDRARAPHPQGRRRLDWRRRRVAARLRQHRHVLRLLADAARPGDGRKPQQPFLIDTARKNCEDWRNTEARMENAEAFLKTIRPMQLKDAPGGAGYLTADAETLRRGKMRVRRQVRALPLEQAAAAGDCDRPRQGRSVVPRVGASADFLDNNFLSDDRRYPVYQLGTNIARARGDQRRCAGRSGIRLLVGDLQAAAGDRQDQRALQPARSRASRSSGSCKGGGRGYYRTPTLISMWATAPYLHNNALGMYVKDPSVRGRMLSFYDSTEKLLWPERRLGVQSIIVTSIDTELRIPGRDRPLRIPAGTPVDLIARVDPREVPSIVQNRCVLNILSDRALFRGLIREQPGARLRARPRAPVRHRAVGRRQAGAHRVPEDVLNGGRRHVRMIVAD